MATPARQATPAASSGNALLAVFITVIAWASAFPLIKIALTRFEPLPLAAGRFFIAGMIAAIWLIVTKPRLPARRDLPAILLCGLSGIVFYNALLNAGQMTVSAGAASFLVNTGPIITALLAAIFLGERFGRVGWLGSLVALSGAGLIAAAQPGGLRLGAGATLVFAAAACQATYFIVQRPLIPRYGALACTAYTIITGALLLLPWLPKAVGTGLSGTGPDSATLALIALAVLPSTIGYAAWTFALDGFGPSRAANFLYLVPPLSVAIAYLLTGEQPRLITLVGGMIAIAGVVIVNFRRQIAGGSPTKRSSVG